MQARRLGAGLVAAGLKPGERFAVLAGNCLEYVACYLAASLTRTVIVPLNARLTAPEYRYILDDAGARLVIGQPPLTDVLNAVRDELPTIGRWVSLATSEGWSSYDDLLGDADATLPEAEREDVVVQMYTSGTTGRPKGVLLSQAALWSSITQMLLLDPDLSVERLQVTATYYHVGGAMSSLVQLSGGGSLRVHAGFDPNEIVDVLEREPVARTFLVPAMLDFILAAVPDLDSRDFSSLVRVGYGGSPIREETLRRAMEVFPNAGFGQGFGQTETVGAITYLDANDHAAALSGRPELLRSAGRPVAGTRVRIVNESGEDCAPGEIGEIVCSGPQLMSGYHHQPEATAEVLVDGWLRTGDAGYLDDAGYLFIVDRLRDVIVSGGENVYPAEVEAVLHEHPAIADCAVAGIPDEKWGEAVCAFVVAGGDLSEDDVVAWVSERLAGYKKPRRVEFVESIPRNASMKVLRRELRAPFWQDRERQV